MANEKKLLLTGVFGPYGIKDDYAEGLGMQMELLNNQITREQNIHSIRQHYWTLPLYLMAENISVPTTVLDFPKWDDFTDELKRGYTHVGINFIVPNVFKVKRMTEYIREYYPEIKIILGGYGSVIPDLARIVSYDELCCGEGVSWLREYFGEDPNAPISHPIIQNPITQSVYGFKMVPNSSVIMPGLGCKNGCEFCITSHKFGKSYIPLLKTGKEIFAACEKIYRTMGATEFFIMDENFLKQPERAIDLLVEMELHKRPFTFEMFSSAEVINSLGVDFLVRLGVKMVWIGVESETYYHAKNKGLDLKALITNLQTHGIAVNTSAILFLDHHDDETIQKDIDWAISLGAAMCQFMNYTPYPSTTLYDRLAKDGRIKDMSYRYLTGQGELNWHHPRITDPIKHVEYTKAAFKKKFEQNGSSILNIAISAVQGYMNAKREYEERKTLGLAWNPDKRCYEQCNYPLFDEFFQSRIKVLKENALQLRPVLQANVNFAPNAEAKKKAIDAQHLFDEAFGKPNWKDITMALGLVTMATKAAAEHALAEFRGYETVILQPPTNRIEYRMNEGPITQRVLGKVEDYLKNTKINSQNSSISPIKNKEPFSLSKNISQVMSNLKNIPSQIDRMIMRIGNILYYE
jgi:hypothetical protein